MGVLKNWLKGVFLGLSIVWSFDAEAICLGSGDARIEALSKAASRNPVDALRLTDLDILAASRSHTSDMRKKAWLEVLRASALALLSRDDDRLETVRSQAHRSLDARDPVLLQLDLFSAYRLQNQNELLERLNAIDAARSHQPAGSAANVCTEISLGYLLYRSGHPELALGKVMEAYSNGKKAGLIRERAEAASVLSMIMRAQWDFDRALELATESIDYASAENMHEQLFVDLLNRGWIYNSLHEHNRALADFGSARQHAQSAGDQSGVGYADEAACQANMDLGRAGEALSRCNSAIALLRAYPDPLIRQAKTYQAAALLGLGQPKRALIILNDVLGGKGDQQVLFMSSAAYMERAHTYAALGRFEQAYADLETSRKTLEKEHEKEITRRQSLLRARFMSDQQRERNISVITHAPCG
jgi:tetratricopeptide (TPR) repeat protein